MGSGNGCSRNALLTFPAALSERRSRDSRGGTGAGGLAMGEATALAKRIYALKQR